MNSVITECLEIITVGLPFCTFKIVAGFGLGQIWLAAWGIIDLGINGFNFSTLIFRKKRIWGACLLAVCIRLVKNPREERKSQWQDLGNSADVLFSFSLVAFMLGSGLLAVIAPAQLYAWNAAVILNVLGAGSSRITASIRGLKKG